MRRDAFAWAEEAASKGHALLVTGPTGTGKSALGIDIARRVGGEVISVDSIAVYRGLDIGTAKPTAEERRGVPHHLLDILAPDGSYSAGEFFKDACKLAQGILDAGRVPIFVGGTMMYVNILQNGISDIPPIPAQVHEEAVRIARDGGTKKAHKLLSQVDPVLASSLSANDRQRLVRGLEVHMATGRPMSDWVAGGRMRAGFGLSSRYLVPADRAGHNEKLRARFGAMMERGLVGEVAGIIGEHGPGIDPLRSVGYRQVAEHVLGKATLADATQKGATATCQLAKRQLTWVRKLSRAGEVLRV